MFEIYFHGYWWRVDPQIKCDKTIRSMAKDDFDTDRTIVIKLTNTHSGNCELHKFSKKGCSQILMELKFSWTKNLVQ